MDSVFNALFSEKIKMTLINNRSRIQPQRPHEYRLPEVHEIKNATMAWKARPRKKLTIVTQLRETVAPPCRDGAKIMGNVIYLNFRPDSPHLPPADAVALPDTPPSTIIHAHAVGQ